MGIRRFFYSIIFVSAIALAVLLYILKPSLLGAWVAWRPSSVNNTVVSMAPKDRSSEEGARTQTPYGLRVAPGFTLDLLAQGVVGARVIAEDDDGNLWVSQTKQGTITRLEKESGQVVKKEIVLSGLRQPHGLAFDPNDATILYVATEDALWRYDRDMLTTKPEMVVRFPTGGRHVTRTIRFGSYGWLYVSIGSTCNVCVEHDERLAAISRINVHAAQPQLLPFASGLRNAVFMTEHPVTHDLIVTEMGRDYLGDDAPPDEINRIKEEQHYGWPWCYGANIHDRNFDTRAISPCREPLVTPSMIDLPAHSAPLGIAFIPKSWRDEWWGSALVALHGSWNSTQPVGYKIIRLIMDEQGRYYGSEDVVDGWLTPTATIGRPVDIVLDRTESEMYISDDSSGSIYVLRPDRRYEK